MERFVVVVCGVVGLCLALASGLPNGAGLTPPLGWSSWCTMGDCGNDYCNEQEVLAVADAMVANGMFALGYNYIVLDDCWADHRDSQGNLQWDVSRFPSGIPQVISELHAKGFKFGLYTSAGNQTCNSGGRPTPVPGSEGHYQQDANEFASWGVDYVKLDWCGDVKDETEIWLGNKYYKEFSRAINNTTPARSIYYIGVAAYLFLLDNVGTYCNGWRAWTDHHDKWETTLQTIIGMQDLALVHGKPGAWPDMDVLTTGGEGCKDQRNGSVHCPGQTDEEYKTEYSMWLINQSPLLVATDLRNMTAVMKDVLLNPELIAIHQDTRTESARHWGYLNCFDGFYTCQLWGRHMSDGSVVIAIFNEGSKSTDIPVSLSQVGWDATTTATVRDLWQRKDIGSVTGKLSQTVPSHGTALLRLTKTS